MTTAVPKPLSGIRVVDLGRFVSAPWCSQILADLGADVIKVEQIGKGDDLRTYGPAFLKDADGKATTDSGHYTTVNRNKRSITIDISQSEGADLVRRMAADADIFLENFKGGGLVRYGLDYEAIARVNPAIVYCSISGFGQTGPYAARGGLDGLFQGMCGLMSVTGEDGGEPQRAGAFVIDEISGVYASTAILAALRHREANDGGGQHIDLSLLDCGVAAMAGRLAEYLIDGTVPRARGTKSPGSTPAQLFRCRDGLINIQAGGEAHYRKLCDVLGLSVLKDDPRFATRVDRLTNEAELIPMLEASVALWAMNDLYEALVDVGVLAGPVYSADQVLADKQVRHRNMAVEVPHPVAGTVPLIASPIRMSKLDIEYRAPPTLGQHTDEILRSILQLDGPEIERLKAAGVV